jgi:hypothetical protein
MSSSVTGVELTRDKLAAALEKDGFPSIPSLAFIEEFLAPEKKSKTETWFLLMTILAQQ